MTDTSLSSTVCGWELGVRLQERRGSLGLTAGQVGKDSGIGSTNLYALEGGKRRVTEPALARLAAVYGLPADELAELEQLRVIADRREWWDDYAGLYPPTFLRFLGLEAGANEARAYEPEAVPGQLQTADYARAMIKGGSPYIRPVEVGPRVEARLARQARLEGENPMRLRAVVGQTVLRQEVGGTAVMRRQLEHLAEVIERSPNIDLRVMPYSAGAHPTIGAAMAILGFPSLRLPDLVWQETITSQGFNDSRQTVRECIASFEETFERALTAEKSLEVIHQVREEMK